MGTSLPLVAYLRVIFVMHRRCRKNFENVVTESRFLQNHPISTFFLSADGVESHKLATWRSSFIQLTPLSHWKMKSNVPM